MSAAASPPGRKALLHALARSAGTVATLLLVYVLLPVGPRGFAPLVFFVVGMCAFLVCVAWQSRAIVKSPTPVFQAIEAIALLVPMAVFVSAGVYLIFSAVDPTAFSEPLNKIDSVYLSATVLTTVGFGDIVPVSSIARIAVTAQMLANLVLVAVTIRVITSAVAQGRRTRK